ncbi:MAG TPA: hypothetical protein VJP60_02500 [Rhizomicrobium sp.]|nr:hypothetical protein [Rhizomicrobium sp.]
MASHAIRSRRRPGRAATAVAKPSSRLSLTASISRIALSRPARAAYMVLGTAGLAAIAVALIGPKRIEREVLRPLRGVLEPQAEKLWADAKPLRDQIAGLFKSASPAGRERLVRSFQSWIGHFQAS